MATPTITEKAAPRGLGVRRDGYSAARAWDVVAGSESEAVLTVGQELGITRGTQYEDHQGNVPDFFALCLGLDASTVVPAPVGLTGLFEVVATYARPQGHISTRPEPVQDGQWQVRKEKRSVMVPADHDVNGFAIGNAAQEPFDTPAMRPAMEVTLVVERLVQARSYLAVDAQFRKYENTVNSGNFAIQGENVGVSRGSLRCEPVLIDNANVPLINTGGIGGVFVGNPWFQVQVRLTYKPPVVILGDNVTYTFEGWDDLRLNLGRRVRTGTVGNVQQYRTLTGTDGNPLSRSVPLKFDGTAQLADGSKPRVVGFRHLKYTDHGEMFR